MTQIQTAVDSETYHFLQKAYNQSSSYFNSKYNSLVLELDQSNEKQENFKRDIETRFEGFLQEIGGKTHESDIRLGLVEKGLITHRADTDRKVYLLEQNVKIGELSNKAMLSRYENLVQSTIRNVSELRSEKEILKLDVEQIQEKADKLLELPIIHARIIDRVDALQGTFHAHKNALLQVPLLSESVKQNKENTSKNAKEIAQVESRSLQNAMQISTQNKSILETNEKLQNTSEKLAHLNETFQIFEGSRILVLQGSNDQNNSSAAIPTAFAGALAQVFTKSLHDKDSRFPKVMNHPFHNISSNLNNTITYIHQSLDSFNHTTTDLHKLIHSNLSHFENLTIQTTKNYQTSISRAQTQITLLNQTLKEKTDHYEARLEKQSVLLESLLARVTSLEKEQENCKNFEKFKFQTEIRMQTLQKVQDSIVPEVHQNTGKITQIVQRAETVLSKHAAASNGSESKPSEPYCGLFCWLKSMVDGVAGVGKAAFNAIGEAAKATGKATEAIGKTVKAVGGVAEGVTGVLEKKGEIVSKTLDVSTGLVDTANTVINKAAPSPPNPPLSKLKKKGKKKEKNSKSKKVPSSENTSTVTIPFSKSLSKNHDTENGQRKTTGKL